MRRGDQAWMRQTWKEGDREVGLGLIKSRMEKAKARITRMVVENWTPKGQGVTLGDCVESLPGPCTISVFHECIYMVCDTAHVCGMSSECMCVFTCGCDIQVCILNDVWYTCDSLS